jgi:hypothetical protein
VKNGVLTMTYPDLSVHASNILDKLSLPPTEKEQIKTCIQRYTMPENWCDYLSWIAFRIKNAVASIFGMSEWQNAVGVIHEKAMREMLNDITPQSNEQYQQYKKVIQPLASKILEKLLEVTYSKIWTKADEVDMQRFGQKISDEVDRLKATFNNRG